MQSSGLLLERLAWIEEIIETMGKRPQGYVRCLKMTAPREIFTRRFSERRPRDLSTFSPTPCKGKLTNACVASLSHPNYGFSSPRYSLIPSLETIALKFWQSPYGTDSMVMQSERAPIMASTQISKNLETTQHRTSTTQSPSTDRAAIGKMPVDASEGKPSRLHSYKATGMQMPAKENGGHQTPTPVCSFDAQTKQAQQRIEAESYQPGALSLGQETEHGVEKDFSSFKIECFFPDEFWAYVGANQSIFMCFYILD